MKSELKYFLTVLVVSWLSFAVGFLMCRYNLHEIEVQAYRNGYMSLAADQEKLVSLCVQALIDIDKKEKLHK
jgi:hypothetical protein